MRRLLTGTLAALRRTVGKWRVVQKIYLRYGHIYWYYYRPIVKKRIDYWGYDILPADRGNDLIARRLESGEPTAIGKLGSVETQALRRFIEGKGKVAAWDMTTKLELYRNAGVFPPDDDIFYRWCLEFAESLKSLDLIAVWYNTYESRIVKRFAPGAKLAELSSLEPYCHKNPWSICLKNRRVLVIHPFEQSIRRQFLHNRDRLWKDARVLPDFELDTIRVPLSDALTKSGFEDWFHALEHMKWQISERQFDVAIIGAGAYSIPLTAHVKKSGKSAVHLGGATQLLFGIKGKRWDTWSIYNEYWTRPSREETPEGAPIVEGGCYW